MNSRIDEIIDTTALIAGGIPGVVSVRGIGSGLVPDPFDPNQTIRAPADAPSGAYEHWSDLADTPVTTQETQNGALRYSWDLPMRLWLPRGDLAEMRRAAAPFETAYALAMLNDPTLGGICTIVRNFRFTVGSDDKYGWLDMNLEVVEVI